MIRTSVDNNEGSPFTGYSLYYEPVQRGIHNRKKLSDGLNRIGAYLVKLGISYRIRECDIGYDELGQLKVYIPPLVILGRDDAQMNNKIG